MPTFSTPASTSAHAEVGLWTEVQAAAIARRRAELSDRHWVVLAASAVVIGMAMLLQVDERGQVGASWARVTSLPPMCGSRYFLGIECPGCGLTRSFVALAAGDFSQSLRFHPLGWLAFLTTLMQVPYRLWGLHELRVGKVSDRSWPSWFGWLLIAAFIANWTAERISLSLLS